ncbi:hypothetical protein GW17_00008304 [Ensete ventricosum]|nr:hypothetical protein GW17_00008304 [Ensete ventricosum]
MRPRERDEDDEALGSEPSPAPPPRRAGGGLSSMVVRPPESGEGEDDEEPRDSGAGVRRRDSPQQRRDSLPPARRRFSPQDQRRREPSPGLRRRESPPTFRRRGSPIDVRRRGGSPGFHSRYQRFHGGPDPMNYKFLRSTTALTKMILTAQWDDTLVVVSEVAEQVVGFERLHLVMGMGGVEGHPGEATMHLDGQFLTENMFTEMIQTCLPGKVIGFAKTPYPYKLMLMCFPCLFSCGNLNFARRTHCNNCNKYRYGPELDGPSRSPRRSYFKSPPLRGSPPRILGPTDHGIRDDLDRYRSPPRGWGVEDLRDFGPTRSPPPARGGKFPDMRRERLDYHDDLGYRQRRKFDWPAPEWEGRDSNRDGFVADRRGYDRRPPTPRGRWISRERSRSPIGSRPLRGAYMGRGRDDHQYDSHLGHGRADDLGIGHGRGYRQAESLPGRSRIDRRGIARGRNADIY